MRTADRLPVTHDARDVDACTHDVGHRGPGPFERALDVVEGLQRLRVCIALSDDGTVGVRCRSSRYVDGGADLDRARVADNGLPPGAAGDVLAHAIDRSRCGRWKTGVWRNRTPAFPEGSTWKLLLDRGRVADEHVGGMFGSATVVVLHRYGVAHLDELGNGGGNLGVLQVGLLAGCP